MKKESVEGLLRHSRLLVQEANAALKKGGLVSALLGAVGGISVALVIATRGGQNLVLPLLFAVFAGLYSFVIYLLARQGRMSGWVNYVVFLPFISLPTFFFLGSHFLMPAGAATFITGPISYLYFHLIIMTGFLFNARLSIAAGVISALGYFLVFWLGRYQIALVSAPDPTQAQDITGASFYLIKSVMMVFGGVVVGALSNHFRRLMIKILREQEEKQSLSKLFGQYVSPEVREKIIQEKREIIGERKTVAVLFSDIRDFSAYSEKHAPEEIVGALNALFQCMVECITVNGGVVDKFIGDNVMAVFGGLIELEKPCDNALQAALDIRSRLDQTGGSVFEIGIGIHYGEVLQGTIGSTHRKDFTVIGDCVNVAARVESLTRRYPYTVIITEEVYSKLSTRMQGLCQRIDRVKIKGKTEEITIYGVSVPGQQAAFEPRG